MDSRGKTSKKPLQLRVKSLVLALSFLVLASSIIIYTESSIATKDSISSKEFFKADGASTDLTASLPVPTRITTLNWERENVFINDNIYLMQGGGYKLKDITPFDKSKNPNPIKILFFGDSHTWGNGNIDRFATIVEQVQDQLDKAVGSNIFDVQIVATNGASTYRHYDYFKLNPISDHNPDIVIYNYFNNDIDPSFNESLICRSTPIDKCVNSKSALLDPKYQSCIHGSGDLLSKLLGRFKFRLPNIAKKSLDAHCQPLYLSATKRTYNPQQSVKDPLNSPYFDTWVRSLKLLASSIKSKSSAPLAIADIRDPSIEKNVEEKMMAMATNGGFERIDMIETKKLIEHLPPMPANSNFQNYGQFLTNLFFVNPGNSHTASHINRLYATDISNYILKTLPPEKIATAKASRLSEEPPTNLVAFTLPYFGTKVDSQTQAKANIRFSQSFEQQYIQRTSSMDKLPFQYLNCANLGMPNFIITLNKKYNNTGFIEITGLPQNKELGIGFYTYDEDYKLIYTHLGKYLGQKIALPPTTLSTSIVLTLPDANLKDCPLDKEIGAPNLDLTISYTNT